MSERLDRIVAKPNTTVPTEVWDALLARAERAEQERDEERKHYELAMQLNDDYLARAEQAEAKVAELEAGRKEYARMMRNFTDAANSDAQQ